MIISTSEAAKRLGYSTRQMRNKLKSADAETIKAANIRLISSGYVLDDSALSLDYFRHQAPGRKKI